MSKITKSFQKKKKEKKQQYGCECYKNLSEDEKQNLVEYGKNHYRLIRNAFIIIMKKHLP